MATVFQKTRVNGFQCPPSRDQIKTLTTYPLTIICCYFILNVTLRWDDYLLTVLMSLNGALSLFLFLAWVTVEYINPEQKEGRTGIRVICFSAPEKSARFCGACRKTVAGLDHHCTWLNTCIGRRNYFSFICLVFIGATQSILHTTIGFTAAIVWINDEESSIRIQDFFGGKLWSYYLAVCIFTAVSGLIAIGLVVLAAFHTYLMLCVRMGTYDWLLHRRGSTYEISTIDDDRDPELSGKERKKQQQREEWQRIIDNPRRKTFPYQSEQFIATTINKEKDANAEDRKSSGSSSGNNNVYTGLDSIYQKGGHRRSSGDFEQITESSSLENLDLLSAQVKTKVTLKSFCVQKEPNTLYASSFRSNMPVPLRSTDRLKQSGTFVESSSCNDLTLGSETLPDTIITITTYGDDYDTSIMENTI